MQLYRFNSCISVKRNQRAERVFVGVAVERADTVRQLFGQHRHDAVREINRGPALKRLAVKRSAWLYIMRNISNMHTEYIPVAVAFQRNCIIEILRVRTVDCENCLIPEIEPPIRNDFFRRDALCFRQNILIKDRSHPVFVQDRLIIRAARLAVSEYPEHFSGGVAFGGVMVELRRERVFGQSDEYFVAILRRAAH